jgi:hypothetical protein
MNKVLRNNVLLWLFYLASGSAAVLWWLSAAADTPEPTFDMRDFTNALRHAANLNGWAALVTGVSVALSLVRDWLQNG